ncbi:MAG TPA: class I SAM-dependent methyltransferase [Stellaceae bacterium]|nr:class I SAM-dependent methyltransferase [Stellaceae bacterium]
MDAPGVIGGLALGGLAGLAAAIAAALAALTWTALALLAVGLVLLAEAALMLCYAWRGKFRHRDRMLALIPWRGDEQVLDVGTGRGLLLVGAAKRLAAGGRAVGIDIWSRTDLSGNAIERTQANLEREGVAARCALKSEPAQAMNFPDASFDVVLSNLCLHNIKAASERDRACREIARVLKPGGIAVISDFRHTRAYSAALRGAGLTATRRGPYVWNVFPPQNIVVARKCHRTSSWRASSAGRGKTRGGFWGRLAPISAASDRR